MKLLLLLIVILGLLSGCVNDAPHDNPLDPESSSYRQEGNLGGRIMIRNQSIGIAGAAILNTVSGASVITDSTGYFQFPSLAEREYQLIVSKETFVSDTFLATVKSGVSTDIVRSLNGAPVVTFKQILTRKIDQYFPSPQYFVDITAAVNDPNGIAELDSVWFGVDTMRFSMAYSVTSKNFHATIYKYQLPTNTIQWLVGKPLTILSQDIYRAMNVSSPFFVTRVIENAATPISPSPFSKDTVSADSVLFQWSPPDVTFNYSYDLSLSRVDAGTQTVVWTYTGLNSFYEEKSYDGSSRLLTGNYVWTISVVDDFGNYGRSKESAFVVQ